ncbi:MAG: TRAM domain-containing protein [Actinomycetaceae bacterium]|nr:TRAM domain-containing protein [Arcanobacterium sp.]MDD7505857.1 TRAM domain-containing protein [Actinomycetaceae bacterium]MDY6142982.1 TRAM domain-containing protein [Arcanobacterium sp.]
MPENSVITLTVTDFAHGGFAVGRTSEGKTAFVRGALPGETVRARVYQSKKRFVKARCVDVLGASAYRIDHPWPEGRIGSTGAADLGHVRLDYQHELKARVVNNQLARIGGEEVVDALAPFNLAPRSLPDSTRDGWYTRTRYDAVVLPGGLGMYEEHSHRIVAISSMPLAVETIARGAHFAGALDGFFDKGERVHIVAPSVGGAVAVGASGVMPLRDGEQYESVDRAKENAWITERVSFGECDFEYRLASGGFWQVHFAAPAALVRCVMKYAQVDRADRVLELFSGAGLLSLPLAQAVGSRGRLLSVEGSQTAVHNGAFNLGTYPWAQARQGWIDAQSTAEALRDVQPSIVIADPPRAGLGVDAAKVIASSKAHRMVLVSCDPAAMARDISVFVRHGWRVENAVALDFFPNTHHIETVVSMAR